MLNGRPGSRLDKRRIVTFGARYFLNPIVKVAAAIGILPPGTLVLETTGRKSGRLRRTPVGGRLEGSTIWIVSEHGRRAGYVLNIAVKPRVRVKLGRRWRSGTARALPDDDWRERLKRIGHGHPWLKLNGAIVQLMRTDPLTVRIDLD